MGRFHFLLTLVFLLQYIALSTADSEEHRGSNSLYDYMDDDDESGGNNDGLFDDDDVMDIADDSEEVPSPVPPPTDSVSTLLSSLGLDDDSQAVDTNGDGSFDSLDTDGDGEADLIGIDTDGDGLIDAFDTDGDGVADVFLTAEQVAELFNTVILNDTSFVIERTEGGNTGQTCSTRQFILTGGPAPTTLLNVNTGSSSNDPVTIDIPNNPDYFDNFQIVGAAVQTVGGSNGNGNGGGSGSESGSDSGSGSGSGSESDDGNDDESDRMGGDSDDDDSESGSESDDDDDSGDDDDDSDSDSDSDSPDDDDDDTPATSTAFILTEPVGGGGPQQILTVPGDEIFVQSTTTGTVLGDIDIPDTDPLTGILFDCGPQLVGWSDLGNLYFLDVENVMDGVIPATLIGNIPLGGSDFLAITYNFDTGNLDVVRQSNLGNSNTLGSYAFNSDCTTDFLGSETINPSNLCGDGDIGAIAYIGAEKYIVSCTTGNQDEGSPNVAILDASQSPPQIIPSASGELIATFGEGGTFTGIIPAEWKGDEACEIPEAMGCVSVDEIINDQMCPEPTPEEPFVCDGPSVIMFGFDTQSNSAVAGTVNISDPAPSLFADQQFEITVNGTNIDGIFRPFAAIPNPNPPGGVLAILHSVDTTADDLLVILPIFGTPPAAGDVLEAMVLGTIFSPLGTEVCQIAVDCAGNIVGLDKVGNLFNFIIDEDGLTLQFIDQDPLLSVDTSLRAVIQPFTYNPNLDLFTVIQPAVFENVSAGETIISLGFQTFRIQDCSIELIDRLDIDANDICLPGEIIDSIAAIGNQQFIVNCFSPSIRAAFVLILDISGCIPSIIPDPSFLQNQNFAQQTFLGIVPTDINNTVCTQVLNDGVCNGGIGDTSLCAEMDAMENGMGIDVDGDGEIDVVGVDSNSDGVIDGIDLDGDDMADIFNVTGVDTDGDGDVDGLDTNGDGVVDIIGIDFDEDGNVDGFDINGDGIIDIVLINRNADEPEVTPAPVRESESDSDSDSESESESEEEEEEEEDDDADDAAAKAGSAFYQEGYEAKGGRNSGLVNLSPTAIANIWAALIVFFCLNIGLFVCYSRKQKRNQIYAEPDELSNNRPLP